MSERKEGLRGSFKIARLSGIGVFIHWSFFLLLLYFLYSDLANGAELMQAARTITFVLAVFACVVLHELGHALMARRFGIGTRDINLLPIGGVARLERMPKEPKQELLIAIAGPAVNILIALIITLVMLLFGIPFSLEASGGPEQSLYDGSFIFNLLLVNLILVIFNFIPAFPMDGGRVLRSLLAVRLPYLKATKIAATIGKIIAVGFVVFALYNEQPMLILIGLFIFFGADSEERAGRLAESSALLNNGLSELLSSDFVVINSKVQLDAAREAALASGVSVILVENEDHKFIGLIDLEAADLSGNRPNGQSQDTLVADSPLLRTIYEPINIHSSKDKAAFILDHYGVSAIPVSFEGAIVGIVKRASLSLAG